MNIFVHRKNLYMYYDVGMSLCVLLSGSGFIFVCTGMDKNIKYIHNLAANLCKKVGRQICRDCF